MRFANSIPITIPILEIFKKDTNTNTKTFDFKKRYQYQYQYLEFQKRIPIAISIPMSYTKFSGGGSKPGSPLDSRHTPGLTWAVKMTK